MNTATAAAPVAAPNKKGRVYLNQKLSDLFGVPYRDNDDVRTQIHTSALDRAWDEWDEAHQALIDGGGMLHLVGAGFGRWHIVG